jgi:hypothetical protein
MFSICNPESADVTEYELQPSSPGQRKCHIMGHGTANQHTTLRCRTKEHGITVRHIRIHGNNGRQKQRTPQNRDVMTYPGRVSIVGPYVVQSIMNHAIVGFFSATRIYIYIYIYIYYVCVWVIGMPFSQTLSNVDTHPTPYVYE